VIYTLFICGHKNEQFEQISNTSNSVHYFNTSYSKANDVIMNKTQSALNISANSANALDLRGTGIIVNPFGPP